jgi:hypothetical protein
MSRGGSLVLISVNNYVVYMETPTSQRKSARTSRVPGLFNDYVQNVIFDDEDFITSDEIEEEGCSSDGK